MFNPLMQSAKLNWAKTRLVRQRQSTVGWKTKTHSDFKIQLLEMTFQSTHSKSIKCMHLGEIPGEGQFSSLLPCFVSSKTIISTPHCLTGASWDLLGPKNILRLNHGWKKEKKEMQFGFSINTTRITMLDQLVLDHRMHWTLILC